jgi:hypothetical protein
MSTTLETAVQVAEIVRRKVDEMFVEVLGALRSEITDDAEAKIAESDLRQETRPSGYDEPWSFDNIDGFSSQLGQWEKVSEVEGENYGWPDGSVDTYQPFVTYRFTGLDSALFALGYKPNSEIIGFVLGAGGGSKRGLTVFWRTDSFEHTKEVISMIRGGGATGRAGFAPGEPLPSAYAHYDIEILRDRVAGKWNVQAVVADASDYGTMLAHTALQAKLRGLI